MHPQKEEDDDDGMNARDDDGMHARDDDGIHARDAEQTAQTEPREDGKVKCRLNERKEKGSLGGGGGFGLVS